MNGENGQQLCGHHRPDCGLDPEDQEPRDRKRAEQRRHPLGPSLYIQTMPRATSTVMNEARTCRMIRFSAIGTSATPQNARNARRLCLSRRMQKSAGATSTANAAVFPRLPNVTASYVLMRIKSRYPAEAVVTSE